ncbi:MAG: hypothetical protein LBO66_05905 [Deltaproteobacteria bacterium]|nr:hypothetical protein [Deltaproteobacteria bacterium]
MSEELAIFLNFQFSSQEITAKVVDDFSYRVTQATRYQANWPAYVKELEKYGVVADSERRPSLKIYGLPQANDHLVDELKTLQKDIRSLLAGVARSRRIGSSVWRKIFEEANEVSLLLASPSLNADINPDNIASLNLRYSYDASNYRACLMAILRDLIVSQRIFDIEIDSNGNPRFPALSPDAPLAEDGGLSGGIPMAESLSRARALPLARLASLSGDSQARPAAAPPPAPESFPPEMTKKAEKPVAPEELEKAAEPEEEKSHGFSFSLWTAEENIPPARLRLKPEALLSSAPGAEPFPPRPTAAASLGKSARPIATKEEISPVSPLHKSPDDFTFVDPAEPLAPERLTGALSADAPPDGLWGDGEEEPLVLLERVEEDDWAPARLMEDIASFLPQSSAASPPPFTFSLDSLGAGTSLSEPLIPEELARNPALDAENSFELQASATFPGDLGDAPTSSEPPRTLPEETQPLAASHDALESPSAPAPEPTTAPQSPDASALAAEAPIARELAAPNETAELQSPDAAEEPAATQELLEAAQAPQETPESAADAPALAGETPVGAADFSHSSETAGEDALGATETPPLNLHKPTPPEPAAEVPETGDGVSHAAATPEEAPETPLAIADNRETAQNAELGPELPLARTRPAARPALDNPLFPRASSLAEESAPTEEVVSANGASALPVAPDSLDGPLLEEELSLLDNEEILELSWEARATDSPTASALEGDLPASLLDTPAANLLPDALETSGEAASGAEESFELPLSAHGEFASDDLDSLEDGNEENAFSQSGERVDPYPTAAPQDPYLPAKDATPSPRFAQSEKYVSPNVYYDEEYPADPPARPTPPADFLPVEFLLVTIESRDFPPRPFLN